MLRLVTCSESNPDERNVAVDEPTRLLADLVKIPSVNPMGGAFVAGKGMLEAGVTEYLDRFFRDLGVPFERIEVAPGRENVIARYDSSSSRRVLLFDAHQDTVPVEGMTIAPFDPRIDGDRLYGRGSCDIKGGLAAMLSAFARLVRERPKGAASVIMACPVDEEFTHLGSSALARSNLKVDLAIVAEPTELNLTNCHKGAIRWKIRTTGRACHSSTPHLGDNAIVRMARVVTSLASLAELLTRGKGDPVLGPPTLSVGRIEGGRSVNVVPDRCEIELDRRLIPGEDAEEARDQVRSHLESALGSLQHVEFLPPWVAMPALASKPSEAWLPLIRHAIATALGRIPDVIGVPYGTDAGPLSVEGGIPCLVFGPGDIAQAHTEDEWVDLQQVRAAADVYYAIAVAAGEQE